MENKNQITRKPKNKKNQKRIYKPNELARYNSRGFDE